jgi:hypothetical protein
VQFIGVLLVFGGYMLVYAAVAHGGVYATEPWLSLYADAYTGKTGGTGPSIPSTNPLAPLSPSGVNPQFP